MAQEPGADSGAERGAAGRWLTIAQAARALGVTERAVRRRIERGTLETRRDTFGNRVRTLVRVAGAVLVSHGGAGQSAAADAERVPDPVQDAMAALREQVARLEERLAASEEARRRAEGEVDAAREELTRRLDEARAERRLLQEAHEAEVDRLLVVVEQLAAQAPERRPERRPWPGLRRWWRRVWEDEGGG